MQNKLTTVAEMLVTYSQALTGEAGEAGEKAFKDYEVILDTLDSMTKEVEKCL